MIDVVLQYSTLDYRFLKVNLEQLSKFADTIIIPVCSRLFNGEPENKELLAKSYEIISNYSKCSVYEFEWEGPKENPAYYHNLSRAIGTSVSTAEWILFLDADEIVEDSFQEWFETVKDTTNSYWLTCYWYFREPIYQATRQESAGLLIRRSQCTWNLEVRAERQQLIGMNTVNGDIYKILSKEGHPLVHHFSWVRSKEEMLKKVQNWGHKHDKSWTDLVEQEFSKEFDGTDFIHNYNYVTVDNKFNL